MTDKVHADFLVDALWFKLVDGRTVIEFADEVIEREEHPPMWAIDISLASPEDPMQLISMLKGVPGESNRKASYTLLGAVLTSRLTTYSISISKLRGICWSLHCRPDFRDAFEPSNWAIAVECDCESFDENWIDEPELRRLVGIDLAMLESSFDDLPTWAIRAASREH